MEGELCLSSKGGGKVLYISLTNSLDGKMFLKLYDWS